MKESWKSLEIEKNSLLVRIQRFLRILNGNYRDINGYWRNGKTQKLLHRDIAYRKIYCKDRDSYPYPFRLYQVHHIDGNKENNSKKNLRILTVREHAFAHVMKRMGYHPKTKEIEEIETLEREVFNPEGVITS